MTGEPGYHILYAQWVYSAQKGQDQCLQIRNQNNNKLNALLVKTLLGYLTKILKKIRSHRIKHPPNLDQSNAWFWHNDANWPNCGYT